VAATEKAVKARFQTVKRKRGPSIYAKRGGEENIREVALNPKETHNCKSPRKGTTRRGGTEFEKKGAKQRRRGVRGSKEN